MSDTEQKAADKLYKEHGMSLTRAAAGCGGCSTPVDPFGGQAADKPEYERIDR
jgi:hypothetical protein